MDWNKKTRNYRNTVLFVVVSIFILSIVHQPLFANHGKEILLKLSDGHLFLPPGKNVQQIKLTTTYSVSDPATVGKQISATMKIYTSNGTLLKTT